MLKGAGSPVLVQTASNLCTFSHNANKSLMRLKGSLSLSLSSAATTKYDSKVKEIPNDGSSNGYGLFEKSSSLIEVIIPSSMTRIGNRIFL